MKPTPEHIAELASQVAEVEAKLERLEQEIAEIGEPAATDLKQRLDALRIEERALIRNLEEILRMDDPEPRRIENAEALLRYIQREEASAENDAGFLHQANPTSAELEAKAAAHVVNFCRKALKRVIGDRQLLGRSVFVNHNRKDIDQLYGADRPPASNGKTGSVSGP